MKQLEHPHIVKLYQVMETKNMIYMVRITRNRLLCFEMDRALYVIAVVGVRIRKQG